MKKIAIINSNGAVVNVAAVKEIEDYTPETGFTAVETTDAQIGGSYDETTGFTPPPPPEALMTVDELIDAGVAGLKTQRDEILTAGFEYNNVRFDSELNSLSMAMDKLQSFSIQSYTGPTTWTGYDVNTGKRTVMTFADTGAFLTFVAALGARFEAVMTAYLQKTIELEAITDYDGYVAIDKTITVP